MILDAVRPPNSPLPSLASAPAAPISGPVAPRPVIDRFELGSGPNVGSTATGGTAAPAGAPDARSDDEVRKDPRVAKVSSGEDSRYVTLKNGRAFIQQEGRVTGIREKGQTDAEAAVLTYTRDGHVSSYTAGDTSYRKSGDAWIKTDPKHPSGQPWYGDITVDHKAGEVKLKAGKGPSEPAADKRSEKDIVAFDSSVTEVGEGSPHVKGDRCLHFRDGSAVTQDASGRATAYESPDGKGDYGYEYSGKSTSPTAFVDPEGTRWTRSATTPYRWETEDGLSRSGILAVDHRTGVPAWKPIPEPITPTPYTVKLKP